MIRRNCLASIDVLVLAGGLGTRIRPVLGDTPKLLAPIGGRPYLWHLLEWLRKFGARRIVLGLGYGADAVLDYLRAQPAAGLDVVRPWSNLPPLAPQARSVSRGRRLRSDPVLVLNGDTFVNADLCALLARQPETSALGTLLCVDVDDAGRYGRLMIDDSGRIKGFAEKDPSFRGAASVSGGVYALIGEVARPDRGRRCKVDRVSMYSNGYQPANSRPIPAVSISSISERPNHWPPRRTCSASALGTDIVGRRS